MEICIPENTKTQNHMEKELLFVKMEVRIQENLIMENIMDMASNNLVMAPYYEDIGLTERQRARESYVIQMVTYTLEHSTFQCLLGMELEDLQMEICMKANL